MLLSECVRAACSRLAAAHVHASSLAAVWVMHQERFEDTADLIFCTLLTPGEYLNPALPQWNPSERFIVYCGEQTSLSGSWKMSPGAGCSRFIVALPWITTRCHYYCTQTAGCRRDKQHSSPMWNVLLHLMYVRHVTGVSVLLHVESSAQVQAALKVTL